MCLEHRITQNHHRGRSSSTSYLWGLLLPMAEPYWFHVGGPWMQRCGPVIWIAGESLARSILVNRAGWSYSDLGFLPCEGSRRTKHSSRRHVLKWKYSDVERSGLSEQGERRVTEKNWLKRRWKTEYLQVEVEGLSGPLRKSSYPQICVELPHNNRGWVFPIALSLGLHILY